MKLRLGALALAVIGGVICFLVVSNLMQPGTLDLTTPTHSDFYRYFLLSEKRWQPVGWLEPRPLMLAYLKIAGVFHQPKFLYLLLVVPALLFVVLMPYVATHAGLTKSKTLPWVVFFIVTFGSPYFYQIYQYDYGGMLSGFFAVLAVCLGMMALVRDDEGGNCRLGALLLSLASVESKPTYSVALLYLALVGVTLFKDRKSFLLFGGVLLILVWTFVKDKIFGSPFVADSDSLSPYAVIVNPVRNVSVLFFYVSHAFTPPLVLVATLSVATLAACREWKLVLITLGLSVSASVPMALLVNRQWETYSWYSTIIIALLVMFAIDRLLHVQHESNKTMTRIGAKLTLALLLVGVVAHSLTRHPSVEWTLENQSYIRNVLQSLDSLESSRDGRKVLMAGVKGPYHPFKNTAYISRQYPRIGRFDVLLRKSEEEWNRMSHELTNGVYLDQLELSNYSSIVIFGADGRVVQKIPTSRVGDLTALERDVLLVCGMSARQDPAMVARIIDCLNDAGEFERAIRVGKNDLVLGERQPWIYYHMSLAYLKAGHAEAAHALALKALAVEPRNETFQSAVQMSLVNVDGEMINAD